MKLSEALRDIKYTLCGKDTEITSVEYNSKNVTKGALFVAINGVMTDGHKYIGEAIKNGAAAILAEREVEAEGVSVAVTSDTRKGMARAASRVYGGSSRRLKVIGITGTNGKTTTTYLIKQILELKGYKTGLIGTNKNMIGKEVIETGRTTPESADLHKLLHQMECEGVTHVVMEVSSHALALDRTYGIEFEAAVFTNLTQDHLDFHNTMEEYCDAKAILFSQSRHGAVNLDDKWGQRILEKAKCPVLTYGIDTSSNLRAEKIRLSERGVIFSLNYCGAAYDVRLGIPGRFSVYNALSALSACLSLGMDMQDIIKGLVLAKGVKGRAEVVQIASPYTVIIDYAHTPDGLVNIINAIRDFVKGRIITVFGCGGDRDKTKRPIMGEIAVRLSDYAVVTSDNPRSEKPEAIIDDILVGIKDSEDKYEVEPDRREAIRKAMVLAKEGDAIILAGKGHETYQILNSGTIDFDERVIVKEIFNQK